MSLIDDLEALETAEDFLAFFKVAVDPKVVRVNRLHILYRFHEALDSQGGIEALDEESGFARAKAALETAVHEFEVQTAVESKVFKVHRMEDERKAAAFVPLDAIRGLQLR